jgi:hypothetical protein
MAAINRDFVVKNGIVIEGDSEVTSSTNQIDALQVDGGAAIAKNLIVGSTATIFGNIFLNQPLLPLSRDATLGSPDNPFSELYLRGNSLYIDHVVITSTGTDLTVSSTLGSSIIRAGSLALSDTTVSTSSTTGALQVAGGAGIRGSLYVGNNVTIQQNLSVTGTAVVDSTLSVAGVASIINSTAATSAGSGALKVTGGARINNNLVVMSTTSNTGTLETNAVYVEGGVGIKGGLAVSGSAVFKNDVYFQGATTYVYSTNTVYTDNLIELHVPPTGAWTFDDGKDVGFRFHYYNNADWNAALIIANDSKKLEFYKNGSEVNGAFVGVYGDFKTGTLQLVNTATSTSTTTGALTVAGGVGIAGNLYVAGGIRLGNINTNGIIYQDANGNLTSQNYVVYNTSTHELTGIIAQSNNLTGGVKGSIPIQSSTGTTTFIAPGTGNSQILTWDPGTSSAFWTSNLNAGTANIASNIAGGNPGAIVYQSNTNSTAFLVGSTAEYMLTYNTSTHAPQWTNPNGYTVGYANTATTATYASIAFTATYADMAFTATFANTSNYATVAGTSTYANIAFTSTYADIAFTSTYASVASTSTFANTSNYAIVAGTSTYANIAFTSTYAGIAFTSTWASTSNYAIVAGTSTYANIAFTSTYAGIAFTSTYAGIAFTSTWASTSTNIVGGAPGSILYQLITGTTVSLPLGNPGEILYADVSAPKWYSLSNLTVGYANTATTSTYANTSNYAIVASTSSYATTATTSTYAFTSTFANTAFTSTWASTSNYAIVAGTSSYATTATTSTWASTSTNIVGGATGSILYQSTSGITTSLPLGNPGEILYADVSAPKWYSLSNLTVGYANTATTSTYANTSNYAIVAGTSTYANIAFTSTYAGIAFTSTFANTSNYAIVAGTSSYATTATTSTYADIAFTSTYANTSNYAIVAGTSTYAFTSTNISGGVAGQLVYQSAIGVTSFVSTGTPGNVLISNGSSIPTYNNTLTLAGTIPSTSTITGALQVVGGVGIGGDMYVGGDIYTNNQKVITTATINSYANQTTITAGTDTAINTATGNITIWNNSTLQSVTNRGNSTTNTISILNTASNTGTLQANALYVQGGIGAGSLFIQGPSIFNSSVVFNGTSTSVLTTNTVYTDNIIELHFPNNTGSQWLVNDGLDIGLRFHYYDTTDRNGFLGRDNGTGYLEWLVNASADNAPNVTGTNGTFRLGSIILTDTTASSSTATGSLTVVGGVGIGGALYVGQTSYVAGAQILTTASVNQYATQTAIFAGTDTAVNTSTGAVTIWDTSTLQSVTGRGSSTTIALSITNATASGSTSTGALKITGGVGIGGGVFVGGNVTATTFFGNLTGVATTATTSTFASTATNIANGAAGSLPYQSSTGTTTFLSIGSNGYVLTSNGTTPIWSAISGLSAGNATTSTNIAGGTAGQVPYQSSTGTTSFYGPGTAGNVLVSNGTSAPSYNNTLTLASTALSTSTGTGALQVRGGLGVADSIYVGNRVGFVGTTSASAVYQYYNTLTNSLDTVFG